MSLPLDAKLLLEAIQFGNEKHAGQVRKGSGVPYISHPIAVSYIVAAFKSSRHLVQLLIAAIVHDCLEDTDATFEEIARRFGPMVASLAQELKNDEAEIARVGKLAYHSKKLLGLSSYALVIKLADRLHNISDNPTRKMVEETVILMQRLREGRKLSRSHVKLVEAIEALCQEKLAEFAAA
jgi:(p)ppGpp synthase/HD superfamily hydrolase